MAVRMSGPASVGIGELSAIARRSSPNAPKCRKNAASPGCCRTAGLTKSVSVSRSRTVVQRWSAAIPGGRNSRATVATQLFVLRTVDHTHATSADLLDDTVVRECVSDHGRSSPPSREHGRTLALASQRVAARSQPDRRGAADRVRKPYFLFSLWLQTWLQLSLRLQNGALARRISAGPAGLRMKPVFCREDCTGEV